MSAVCVCLQIYSSSEAIGLHFICSVSVYCVYSLSAVQVLIVPLEYVPSSTVQSVIICAVVGIAGVHRACNGFCIGVTIPAFTAAVLQVFIVSTAGGDQLPLFVNSSIDRASDRLIARLLD